MKELFAVSELRDRYGIKKQAEINRRKHLGIKPVKYEGSYYVTEDQLKLLDSLHDFLAEQGGKMADFDPEKAVDSLDSTTGITRLYSEEATNIDYQEATLIDSSQLNPEWSQLIEKLAEKLSPARSPLQNWRELEEAFTNGWLLTTKQVHELAGAKPHGTQWQRGSFIFIKTGKIGSQSAWQVKKV